MEELKLELPSLLGRGIRHVIKWKVPVDQALRLLHSMSLSVFVLWIHSGIPFKRATNEDMSAVPAELDCTKCNCIEPMTHNNLLLDLQQVQQDVARLQVCADSAHAPKYFLQQMHINVHLLQCVSGNVNIQR